MMVDQIAGLNDKMSLTRKRISGRLESTARGFAIVTEPGDYWVLEEFNPNLDLLCSEVDA